MEEQRDGEVRDDQNNLQSSDGGVTDDNVGVSDDDVGVSDDDVEELDQRDVVEYEEDEKINTPVSGVTISRLRADEDVKKQESNELEDYENYLHRFIEFITSLISGLYSFLLCCVTCFILCCITCYYLCRVTWFVYFHRNELSEFRDRIDRWAQQRNELSEFGDRIDRWAHQFIPQAISIWNEEERVFGRDTNALGDPIFRLGRQLLLRAISVWNEEHWDTNDCFLEQHASYTGDEGDREFGRNTNRNGFFAVTALVAPAEESIAGEIGGNNGGDNGGIRMPRTPWLKKLLLKLSRSFM